MTDSPSPGSDSPPPRDPMNWALSDLKYFIPNSESSPGRLKAVDISRALIQARGNITLAGRLLSKSREYVKKYIDKTPALLHLMKELRGSMLDDAEYNFARAVELGNLEASKFILQTFGKERGYIRPGVTATSQDSSGNKVTFTIEG